MRYLFSMKKRLKHCMIIGIFFVLITGTLSHFYYDWSGRSHIVGFFTPVNESVWEHMKLVFFPMLLYSLFIIFKFREKRPCIISSLFWGILTGTLLIPLLFFAYTSILGRNIFILAIGTFVLSTVTAFWLSYKLALSCKLTRYAPLLCILTAVLFACFIVFTYHPPEIFPPLWRSP